MASDEKMAQENQFLLKRLVELNEELRTEGVVLQDYPIRMLELRVSAVVDALVKSGAVNRLELDTTCNRVQVAGIEAALRQHRYNKSVAKIATPSASKLLVARR